MPPSKPKRKEWHNQKLITDGWMICDFTSFLTVFQSYQDDDLIRMKSCVQWNFVYSWEDFASSGDRTQTARSVGQRLTYWATGAPREIDKRSRKTRKRNRMNSSLPNRWPFSYPNWQLQQHQFLPIFYSNYKTEQNRKHNGQLLFSWPYCWRPYTYRHNM